MMCPVVTAQWCCTTALILRLINWSNDQVNFGLSWSTLPFYLGKFENRKNGRFWSYVDCFGSFSIPYWSCAPLSRRSDQSDFKTVRLGRNFEWWKMHCGVSHSVASQCQSSVDMHSVKLWSYGGRNHSRCLPVTASSQQSKYLETTKGRWVLL